MLAGSAGQEVLDPLPVIIRDRVAVSHGESSVVR